MLKTSFTVSNTSEPEGDQCSVWVQTLFKVHQQKEFFEKVNFEKKKSAENYKAVKELRYWITVEVF